MIRSARSAIIVLAILAIALAGLWLRAAHTLREPLWLDEAYSAYAAAKGFDFLWHIVPRYETHPPFYYSLLRLWTLPFGDSLVAHRALGVTCGMATLAVAILIGREIARRFPATFGTGRPLAIGVMLLAAFSPSLVEMSREVRPYPVMILVYAGVVLALLRLGRIAGAETRIDRPAFAAYLAGLALMLWLHNLGPLWAAAIGLAFLRPLPGNEPPARILGS